MAALRVGSKCFVLPGFKYIFSAADTRRLTQTILSGRPAYSAQALAMAGRHDRTKTTCPFGERYYVLLPLKAGRMVFV